MKQIRLKTLVLSNWRAQNRRIDFSGKTLIRGRNRSGKSTTLDALLWLLTGYDSEDRYNYMLFDTSVAWSREDCQPAIVEGIFDIDGCEYSLKRRADMGWTRPRGAEEYVKKNTDDYSFYRDGVEMTSGDYGRFVESVFGPVDHLKFMLNISYYRSLDWKELRKSLAEIIGDVKDSDYEGDFSEISGMVSRYGSIDAVKDVLKGMVQPLRISVGTPARRGTLAVEIDTMEQNLPDTAEAEEAARRRDEIQKEIDGIDRQLAGISDSIRPMTEKRNARLKEIADMRSRMFMAEARYNRENDKRIFRMESDLKDAERHNQKMKDNAKSREKMKRDAEDRIYFLEKRLVELQDKRTELLERNRAVKEMEFRGDRCVYCGQTLPPDMLEDAKAGFEEKKEREHQAIVAEGRRNNENMASIRAEIQAIRMESQAESGEESPIDTQDLRDALAKARGETVPFADTEEGRRMAAEIEEAERNLPELPKEDDPELMSRKSALMLEYRTCSEKAGQIRERARLEHIIEEKRENLRKSAAELARIEGLMAKAEEMERQRAEIIGSRIRSMFSWCRVEMEQRKKDGTMQPACNIILDGVPSQVTNTASKMLVGIDLSNAFSVFHGVSLPLFVDNNESMDPDIDLNPKERQLVLLRREDCGFTVEEL